jgi:hypothetical protein
MTPITNELRDIKHINAFAPPRSSHPSDSVQVEGQGKLNLLKERWSEISNLLTLDFWADFLFVYMCLTSGVVCVLGMILIMNR